VPDSTGDTVRSGAEAGSRSSATAETAAPVHDIGDRSKPQDGVALCLSGGGYRAMVFHLGALWRLNEAGLLKGIRRISSVSGGSITAGLLGLKWKDLDFNESNIARAYETEVVKPIRGLAGRTIDAGSVIAGVFLPGTVSERVVAAYDKHLYRGATLQDLPSDADGPRFVINATNVQTGALWRFMKPYMRDFLVGEVKDPDVPLAQAVGASSAFPPVLSPTDLEVEGAAYTPRQLGPLGREPFTTQVVLTDGGVYDNLGLETAWKKYKTVLVSDGGARMDPQEEPHRDWARHVLRILDIIDNQVRSLRKRQLIDSYKAKLRDGAYWGIRTDIADYRRDHPALTLPLDCPRDRTIQLAAIPTRLARIDDEIQERLINWGYAVCDAALRAHHREGPAGSIADPAGFPYPGRGV
jgi:NTE family protein